MKQLTVGVDISKSSVDVAYMINHKVKDMGRFTNDSKGLSAVFAQVEAKKDEESADSILVVVEPTGGYEQLSARFALKVGWQVALPNPRAVRHWEIGMGIRAKTDKVDAAMLARYGVSTQPPLWQPPLKEIEILSALLSRLSELQEMQKAEINRLSAAQLQPVSSPQAIDSIQESIAFLKKQIERLQENISTHFKDHDNLKEQRRNLVSVPGVGDRIVNTLLVSLHRFASLTDSKGTAKSLTAYAGLDEVPYQSGTSINRPAAISKQGSKFLIRSLFLGALGGKRGKNSPLAHFYQRLVGRGKPKMVALIACARKILVWSWAIFQQNVPFDMTRFSTV